jgi:transcription antitermination factor NusG
MYDDGSRPAWFAVVTKSRHEKLVSQQLRSKGIEEFLPMYPVRKRWSDRYMTVELPLFTGYVFCRFQPEQTLPILSTTGVASIVSFGGRPAPIPETEIDSVKAVLQSGLPASPWPYLRAGERVRIRSGAMDGVEGVLLRDKDSLRVVVSVELLQRSVAVEIDRDVLEPAGKASRRVEARPGRL